jgi:hypothetical protein
MRPATEENDVKKATLQLAKRTTLAVLIAATTLFMGASTATAQDAGGLASYLNVQNDIVMGMNVSGLRSNKYYDKMVEWARSQSGGGELLKAFEQESGLDIEKDIDALAIAFRSNASMQQQQQEREFAMAISGTFDKKKLLAAIKKQDSDVKTEKIGGLEFYKSDDVWLAVPKNGLALMTAGDDAYVKKNIATFGNKKDAMTSKKLVKKMLSEVDTSEDIWIAGDMTGVPSNSGGPSPNALGMEMDFASGLDMEMLAQMDSADDANKSVEQMKSMKSQGASNPMVAMLGAKPLLDNLKITSSGSKVRFNTEMSPKEFDSMVAAITQMAQSQGMGGAPAAQPSPGKSGSSGTNSSDGADADFN